MSSPGSSATSLRPDQLGSISGKVVDAKTGTAVTEGWVIATKLRAGSEGFGARIQPDGSYRIHRLEPGAYVLRVQAEGYAFAIYRPNASGNVPSFGAQAAPVTVTAANDTSGIDFPLAKAGVLSGRVTDERGKPIAGAQILVFSEIGTQDQTRMVQTAGGQTDRQGEYRIDGMQVGEYLVAASDTTAGRFGNVIDRSDPLKDTPFPTYDRTFYPGVTEQSQATRINLEAGEERYGIDVVLHRTGGFKVSGRILNVDGLPSFDCTLLFRRKSEESLMGPTVVFTSVNMRDGTFVRSGLSSGVYRVTGGTRNAEPPGFLNDEVVIQDRDIEGLVLQLRPGSKVKGSLRLDGKPTNQIEDSPRQSRIFLTPADNSQIVSFQGMSVASRSQGDAIVNDKGEFSLDVLPPLIYKVRAMLADGYYLSQALIGGRDVTGGLDLTQSAGEISLQLIAKSDAGSVSGNTANTDGVSEAGIEVRLYPTGSNESREDFFRTAVSDQSGQFSITTVPPGDYVAIAFPSSGYTPSMLSRHFDKLKQRGTRLTVRPNSQQRLQLKSIRLEDLK
jgi:hypothetical protein